MQASLSACGYGFNCFLICLEITADKEGGNFFRKKEIKMKRNYSMCSHILSSHDQRFVTSKWQMTRNQPRAYIAWNSIPFIEILAVCLTLGSIDMWRNKIYVICALHVFAQPAIDRGKIRVYGILIESLPSLLKFNHCFFPSNYNVTATCLYMASIANTS